MLTGLAGSAGDDAYATIGLPFSFSFYNRTYNSAYVNTNGFVAFTDPATVAAVDPCADIPSSGGVNNAIYVFCDDLITDGSSSVRWSILGSAPDRQVVIEWNNVLRRTTTERISANVILAEGSSDITLVYNGISTTSNTEKGSAALVGIENPWSNQANKFLYHQALLSNSTVVRYHPQPQVLINPGNFTFTAGAITDVASYQYDLDVTPPTTTVAAASLGGSATVSITPPVDGAHTLYVRSVDRAGNVSTTKSYQVNVGYGGILSPHEGDMSAAKTSLSVAGSTAATGVTFQWRRADTDTWAPIPAADVTLAAGGGAITWPVPATTPGTFPKLNWNLEATLTAVDPQLIPRDGPVQFRAIFNTGPTSPVKISFDRNQASAASTDVGPGAVNLLTGNLTVSDSDVSVDSYGSDLTVTRTYNTRQSTATDTANMFGPGWASSAIVTDAEAPYTNLTVYGSLVQVGLPDGDTIGFTQKTGITTSNRTYIPDTGFEDLTLTYTYSSNSYTLKDTDGNVVTFTYITGAATNLYNPTAVAEPGSGQTTALSWQKVTVGTADVVRPTQMLAPVPAGVTCTTLVRGCRALTFTYASTTTATGTTSGTWGDYAGRVSQVSFTAWDPDASPAAMRTVVMARYAYDSNGRLRQQWDPRLDWTDTSVMPPVTAQVAVTYDYDTDGILNTITPAGQQPWQLAYTTLPSDPGKGRLAAVTRSALSAGTAVTTVVYKVPTTGTGAPWDLSASQTNRWGQLEQPTDAAAVYPPTQVPTGVNQATGTLPTDYTRATVTYMDANGRQVNTVDPAGATTAVWFDRHGNTTRTITASNIRRALDAAPSDSPAQEAAIAGRESTVNIYNNDGTELRETFGPEHDLVLPDGSLVRGRDHTVTVYDQGASGGPYHLPTTSVTSVQYLAASGLLSDADTRTTTTGYDWSLRQPVISTADPSGLALATRTTYDAATGLTTSTTAPAGGTSSNIPATRQTIYYRTGTGSGYSECDSHPEWANLICRSQPGGQATSGPELPVAVTTYDMFDQVRTLVEKTTAGTLRTTTNVYDGAGRLLTADMTGASGTGATVPTRRMVYDPATGLVTRTQTVSGGSVTAEIVREYDALGRLTSYADADGNTATTTYDLAGRVATTNDGKGTRTFTYDGGSERRSLATSVLDSEVGTFSSNGYNVDGVLTSETWPNGVVSATAYDETGDKVGLSYVLTGCGQADCTVYAETAQSSAHGQQRIHSSTLSSQVYSYDNSGRLASVSDMVDGQCTTRTYGFNEASDRTSLVIYGPGVDGSCQITIGSTITASYDGADRITVAGYTYDTLGRTTTVPASATGIPAGGDLSITYHVTDLARTLVHGGRTTTYTLDVTGDRMRTWSDTDGTTTTTRTNHYAGDSDSPIWTDESNGLSTRIVGSLDGLAAITSTNGVTNTDWQLANLHGDCIATIHNAELLPATVGEQNEYGQARDAAEDGQRRYGWLGAEERASDTPSGVVLMGVRLYNPASGRFLSRDPIMGGSCNDYDYACQDPINKFDTDGRNWFTSSLKTIGKGLGCVTPAVAFACAPMRRAQAWGVSLFARSYAFIGGGRCRKMNGLMTCTGVSPWMYPKGGITIGNVYITGRSASYVSSDRLAHESDHKRQWNRWGAWFVFAYAFSGFNPCKNRFEKAANLVKGGYTC